MPDTQMDDEMVERAARILDPDAFVPDYCKAYPRWSKGAQEDALLMARAALEAALSGYVVVPRAVPHGFKTGDRVRHTGRDEVGAVAILDNGNVQVTFDNPNPRGGKSIGEYDANWFKIYPRGLVAEGEAAE